MMKDVQGSPDYRGIPLQRVGVKDIHLPLSVRMRDGNYQSVLASIDLCADLAHHYRGTHMSRLIQGLYDWSQKNISSLEIEEMLQSVRGSLEAQSAEVTVSFRYFIPRVAPVSRERIIMDYQCLFKGVVRDDAFTFILGVEAPVHLVCPCSKDISEYGAHNQRALIKAHVEYGRGEFIWLEELIDGLSGLGSSEIFPLLKRSDEKFVTEQGYENAKFVEDVVRDAVLLLRGDRRIVWFEVECLSAESIHNHNAFAFQSERRAF